MKHEKELSCGVKRLGTTKVFCLLHVKGRGGGLFDAIHAATTVVRSKCSRCDEGFFLHGVRYLPTSCELAKRIIGLRGLVSWVH